MVQHRRLWGKTFLILLVVGYMSFLILAPITALVNGAFRQGLSAVLLALVSPVLLQSLLLSLEIAVGVVTIQVVFGTIVAWVIVRHDFRGKSLLNGLLDIPFSVSPVVVGYMLLLLFGREGVLSPLLESLNVQVAFAVPGIFLATLFVALPFSIREMIPAIENLDRQQEFAAATLGANTWTTFWRITVPGLKSAFVYGMTLTLARALGEFGAVLVIGGGVQGRTETTTLYIYRCLEERQYVEAYSASILLGLFAVLVVSAADWIRQKSAT
jgi:sulfate transport system permease protein